MAPGASWGEFFGAVGLRRSKPGLSEGKAEGRGEALTPQLARRGKQDAYTLSRLGSIGTCGHSHETETDGFECWESQADPEAWVMRMPHSSSIASTSTIPEGRQVSQQAQ